MYKHFTVMVNVGLACFFWLSQARGEAGAWLEHSDRRIGLVRARVTKLATEQDGRLIATIKIEHIYCGPFAAKDKEFKCITSRTGMSWGFSVTPTLSLGEEGIWGVKFSHDLIDPLLCGVMGISSPARKGISVRYEQAEVLANVIEQACLAENSTDQAAFVKKAIFHDVPEVSVWAIQTLEKFNNDKDKDYLLELVGNTNVTVLGQVALDSVLKAQKGDAWANSSARQEFLKALLACDDLKPFEATEVVSMLGVIAQHDSIGRAELMDLVETAIANENLPKVCRDSIFDILGRMVGTRKDTGKAYNLLIEEVGGNRESKMAAAYAIKNHVELNDERKKPLRKLMDTLNDVALKNVIDESLKKPPRKD